MSKKDEIIQGASIKVTNPDQHRSQFRDDTGEVLSVHGNTFIVGLDGGHMLVLRRDEIEPHDP